MSEKLNTRKDYLTRKRSKGVLHTPSKEARSRVQKSSVAELIAGQRDVLQVVYDWDIEDLKDEDVSALHDLIQHMGRVVSRYKQ